MAFRKILVPQKYGIPKIKLCYYRAHRLIFFFAIFAPTFDTFNSTKVNYRSQPSHESQVTDIPGGGMPTRPTDGEARTHIPHITAGPVGARAPKHSATRPPSWVLPAHCVYNLEELKVPIVNTEQLLLDYVVIVSCM